MGKGFLWRGFVVSVERVLVVSGILFIFADMVTSFFRGEINIDRMIAKTWVDEWSETGVLHDLEG